MCGLSPCDKEKCTWGEKYRLYCLENFKDKVKKLDEMSFKDAEAAIARLKAKKGEIAALEIWKSSKHWEGHEKRKNR